MLVGGGSVNLSLIPFNKDKIIGFGFVILYIHQ